METIEVLKAELRQNIEQLNEQQLRFLNSLVKKLFKL